KKDKLIEEAQKLALRGQFDKAARVYEQILILEPAAINLRQKLAELLIKCSRNDDARKELEIIGRHFSKNGFYLKAIAVYKQLQKLFPADVSISLTLAELNEKHGLIANALSEYKLVYEFYENADNVPEALSILGKMQNVDPLNIAIKIKLAEANFKHGKKEDSYAVFSKTASLLLERRDNTTLSKVCTRIQQIFPEKPDFMFEVLAELVQQGNAASAIESIQGLLRSNPNNKHTWGLVIQAFEQLEQPQRVKVAYQHFLKFFPSEPAAMSGLIASVTLEQNLAAALELLDKYETTLISAGFTQQLEQVYNALDKIDPINIRILEGLINVATATGNENEIRSLTSKLRALHSVAEKRPDTPVETESSAVFVDVNPFDSLETSDLPFFGDVSAAQEETSIISTRGDTTSLPPASDLESFYAAAETFELPDEEIEIDIDLDSPFDSPEQDGETTLAHDNWLDSANDLFNSISIVPRGVRFGNEMESSDAQSHFDLGQAFKEMGLFDEAINEFRQASQDPSRRLECLIMQCVCLKERGEVEKSISMLLALLKPGLSVEDSCTVKYELASGLEAAGRKDEANTLLNEINIINPGFRDISSRLNDANLSESLDFSDDDLKDF
ncbi:MAG: tetratricopeptide repeat protein, partial [Desulfuromonadales bacterium]